MAEVKIIVTAEDGSQKVFRAVEEAGTSAFKKIGQEAVSSSSIISGAVEKCKESYINFAAKAITLWHAINEAADYAKLGASALQAEESFKNVANAYDEDGNKLLAKMKEVSNGIIDDSDLMQRAVKGLQQGLSGDQLVSLLEVARSSARVAGTDVASVFDRITEATASQITRGLKALGIVIDQNKAFEEHAKKIGTSADALTELQQSQALANAAIEEGHRQMKAMGEITENATEKIQKSEAQIHELKETLGKGLLVAVHAIGGAFYWLAGGGLTLYSVFLKVGAGMQFLKGNWDVAKQMIDDAGIAFEAAGETANKGMEIWENISLETSKASEGTKGLSKAQQEAAAAASIHAAEQKKLSEAYTRIDEWNTKIDAMNPALTEVDKGTLALADDVTKLGLAFGNLPGMAKKLSDIFDKGMGFLHEKQAREDATKALEIVKDYAVRKAEIEKKGYEDLIVSAKDYRDSLVKTYDDAIAEANKFFAIADKGKALASNMRAYLDSLNAPKLSPAEQMAKEKEAFLAASASAWKSGDLDKLDAAFKQGQSFLEKFKGSKDILGMDADISTVTDQMKDIVTRTESVSAKAAEAGDAWTAMANKQISAIQSVDEWMKYLNDEVVRLDGLLAQTKEIKIDTSMATSQINGLIQQVMSLNGMLGAASVSHGLNNSGLTRSDVEPAFAPDSQAYADWASMQNWPQYATGTDYVPRTGPAIIHQGERIIPAEQNRSGASSGPVTININGYNKDAKELAIEIRKLVSNGRV